MTQVAEEHEAALVLLVAERGAVKEVAAVEFLGEQQRILKFRWT